MKCVPNRDCSPDCVARSLSTEGVNLFGIREYAALIDVNKINSNDIDAILR